MNSPGYFSEALERVRRCYAEDPQLVCGLPALCARTGVPESICAAAVSVHVNKGLLAWVDDTYLVRGDHPAVVAAVRRRTA